MITIPPRRNVRKAWPNFTLVNPGKGLNNVISDEFIANEEASDLSNIMFVEAGNPAKRNGRNPIGTGLSIAPKGLASFYATVSGVINRYLVTIDDTALKYLSGSTWTAVTGATFTTGKNTTFTQARGDLYICNGTDPIRKLDKNLTLTAPATTPTASFSIYYNGYHFASGVASQPSRLYVSNPTDASDFTVATGGTAPQPDNSTDVPGATVFSGTPGSSEARIYDVSKDDGDRITAMAKFQQLLIVFKERSTWSFSFDANGNAVIQQVSATQGCVSHRSIDNVENDLYFLSRNGYYILGNQPNYFNVIRTNELSSRIHPTITTITANNLGNTASIYNDYTFYSSVSTGGTTTNNTTLTFDTRYGAWSKWSNINANAFTIFIDSSNVKHLYYAADDEAQVYEIDTSYTDNGTAIDAYWTSKNINFGDISLQKQLLYIDVEMRVVQGSVKIDVITDGNVVSNTSVISSSTDTGGTFGDFMFDEAMFNDYRGTSLGAVNTPALATANVPYRIPINKPTRTFKVKISNSGNNETFVLLGFKAYYRPYAPEKFDSRYKLSGGVTQQTTTSVPTGTITTEAGDYLTLE